MTPEELKPNQPTSNKDNLVENCSGLYHYVGPTLILYDTKESHIPGNNKLLSGSMFVVLNVERDIAPETSWDSERNTITILTQLGIGYLFLYSQSLYKVNISNRTFIVTMSKWYRKSTLELC